MPLPRAIVQFQGDLGLRSVGHAFRNFRLPTAGGIGGPTFRQEQLTIEQAMKIFGRVGQMHGDDAVFLLAQRAQVLPLHTRSLPSLFHKTGFIDDAHRMWMRMFCGNDILQAVAPDLLANDVD